MRRKLVGSTYSNSLEFGVRDGSLIAPSGLISSQNVDLTIQSLVGRSRGVTEFDQLPIPFRAVATDMQSGEMVVLDRGDLALAMRASMAVPGVFSPVEHRRPHPRGRRTDAQRPGGHRPADLRRRGDRGRRAESPAHGGRTCARRSR